MGRAGLVELSVVSRTLLVKPAPTPLIPLAVLADGWDIMAESLLLGKRYRQLFEGNAKSEAIAEWLLLLSDPLSMRLSRSELPVAHDLC